MQRAAPGIDRSSQIPESDAAVRLGFRFGNKGTHSSRTLMLAELEQLMAGTTQETDSPGYLSAIVEDNLTDKKTVATRRITGQRLRELYALDPAVPIFRAFRHLWDVDIEARPLLALLCSLARDPPADEPPLVKRIIQLASDYGRYGYRRVTALLRGEGWIVNHKRVERLWRQEGLKVPQKQPKRRRLWLADGSCVRLRPMHRDHVWRYDFVLDCTSDGRRFRMLTLIESIRENAGRPTWRDSFPAIRQWLAA